MLCCVEALGPVRFDHWDDNGKPVPRYPTAPIIRCFATEEDQAGNTFEGVYYMLSEGPAVDEFPGLDVGLTRINLPDGGRIVATTSAAASKDGGKDTFNVFDETHLWVLPNLKKLHATVTRNIMKRALSDGWSLETSTMYAPGEESVAELTHKSARTAPGVLFDHKQAPEVDLEDDDEVLAALAGVYGPAAAWMDLDAILASQLRDPQARQSDFQRYWLNQPTTVEDKFTEPARWDRLAQPDRFQTEPDGRNSWDGRPIRPIPDGTQVVLAFDGSRNNDSTVIVAVTCDAAPYVDVVFAWERDFMLRTEQEVDVLEVEEQIRAACRRWRVTEIAADEALWQRSLQVLANEGLPAVKFPQSGSRMTPATKHLSDVIATGELHHSGDERLRRHMLNAVVRDDYRGYRLTKPDPKSHLKIDLAVATVMGVQRALELGNVGTGVWNLNDFIPKILAEEAAARAATATPAPSGPPVSPAKPGDVRFVPLSEFYGAPK